MARKLDIDVYMETHDGNEWREIGARRAGVIILDHPEDPSSAFLSDLSQLNLKAQRSEQGFLEAQAIQIGMAEKITGKPYSPRNKV